MRPRINNPAKPKFKAILFDKDGTLVDFNGTWLALYEKLALEAAEGDRAETERLLAIGGYDRAANVFTAGSELAAGTSETIVRLWIGEGDAKRSAFWKARMDRAFVEEGPAAAIPVPGLAETLRHLHGEGRALAVVTNDFEAAARKTIEKFGVSHLFSAFLGYDSVKNPEARRRPSVSCLQTAGRRAGRSRRRRRQPS